VHLLVQTSTDYSTVVLTAVFYFPPPRVNSQGLSTTEVLKQVDFVGGLLSVSGMILFMAGMRKFSDLERFLDEANVLKNGAATSTHGAALTY
jgi:hypothetical protein